MRLAGVALLLLTVSAHAEERWSADACKSVQELEAFYTTSTPDLTSRAWAIRPLLVLQRDHCGTEVSMKIQESEKVIKLRLWPAHVCDALAGTRGVRAMLAKQIDKHCSENEMKK